METESRLPPLTGAIDVEAMALRLIEVSKKVTVTDAAIGTALDELRHLGPWRSATHEQLGADFRRTTGMLGREIREFVATALPSDGPAQSLSLRRARLHRGSPSGTHMRTDEAHVYARVLFAMVASTALHTETPSIAGFVVRNVTADICFTDEGGYAYDIKLTCIAARTGMRVMLIPVFEECPTTMKGGTRPADGSDGRYVNGFVMGRFPIDITMPARGHYVAVALDQPTVSGEAIDVVILGGLSPRDEPGKRLPSGMRWECLGTEETVRFVMQARGAYPQAGPKVTLRRPGEVTWTDVPVAQRPESDDDFGTQTAIVTAPSAGTTLAMTWDLARLFIK